MKAPEATLRLPPQGMWPPLPPRYVISERGLQQWKEGIRQWEEEVNQQSSSQLRALYENTARVVLGELLSSQLLEPEVGGARRALFSAWANVMIFCFQRYLPLQHKPFRVPGNWSEEVIGLQVLHFASRFLRDAQSMSQRCLSILLFEKLVGLQGLEY
ncbi:unnamed protein product [Symbiodinium pilosum]|uniref:Uncharacterized protein n=1 Tax=Symbiodinium pilosum TaxID=2952 RepID=A0A812LBR5_SYMPI|nr:unnamed protein product [Symbiodinium pilosum]